MKSRLLAVAYIFCLLFACQTGALADNVTKQVLVFYYGWYKGDWAHTAHWQPRDGSYQSMDPATIERQMVELQNAGVTGIIASWWPKRGSGTDAQLPLLIEAAERHGLKVTVLVEQFGQTKDHVTPEIGLSDLRYILDRYGRSPAWLTAKGHPVIMIYGRALHQLSAPGQLSTVKVWDDLLDTLRKRAPGAFVLTTGTEDFAHNSMARASFDGGYAYGMTGVTHGKSLPDIRIAAERADLQRTSQAKAAGQIAIATVSPGYDDTQTKRTGARPVTDRYRGETYQASWEAALKSHPDWVLISTYNEWIEGSQIEPSAELGDQALQDTARYARKFISGK